MHFIRIHILNMCKTHEQKHEQNLGFLFLVFIRYKKQPHL